MYTGLLHSHHWLRYIALLLLLISIVKAIMDLKHKGESIKSKKTELYAMIAMHIQLIIGLILFFVSPKIQVAMADMGSAMKDADLRLALIEHPLVMLIAIILITVGYMKLKAIDDRGKYGKTVLLYYGIALILILSRIPMYSWTF
jgi:uncharacterized BrkB/YihY/UPF0761 family membrane protein